MLSLVDDCLIRCIGELDLNDWKHARLVCRRLDAICRKVFNRYDCLKFYYKAVGCVPAWVEAVSIYTQGPIPQNVRRLRLDGPITIYSNQVANVTTLIVDDSQIRDSQLSLMPRIQHLVIGNNNHITIAGISELSELTLLRIHNARRVNIAGLTIVRRLIITGDTINGLDDRLSKLTQLESLTVHQSDVTSKSIRCLTRLERLDISDCNIDDAGIVQLTRLRQLEANNTLITDAGIAHLTQLSHLKAEKTVITAAFARRLPLMRQLTL